MEDSIQALKKEVENWLATPMENGIESAIHYSEELDARLQEALQSDPEAGQLIGPLIGKVKGLQKRLNNIEAVNWVKIGGGSLAIGHRPSNKLVSDIKLQSGTHILTLLSESEGAKAIQKETLKQDMTWLWLGMNSAEPPAKGRMSEFTSLFDDMIDVLENGGKIYLHCSAGIHRTGMISYAFLRYLGYSSDEAETRLKELRPTTSEGVGKERMAWGEQFSD